MRRKTNGQATIIILTLMAMAVGMALVITRSVRTDIQITKVQEESARAFSAAEAGIESALYSWEPSSDPHEYSLETGEVSVLSTDLGKDKTEFVFPGTIKEGDFGIIWLVGHDENGNIDQTQYHSGNFIRACWEDNAALELILFYRESVAGDYKTERWAYDPNDERRGANNFDKPKVSGCAGLDLRTASLRWPDGSIPLFLAVKVFYGDTPLGGWTEGTVFLSQGKLVTSTGQVQSGADQVVSRRLQVLQTWDLPPLIFIDPVFSGGGM